jgi:hypothetical protein
MTLRSRQSAPCTDVTTVTDEENPWAHVTICSGAIVCVQQEPIAENASCDDPGVCVASRLRRPSAPA